MVALHHQAVTEMPALSVLLSESVGAGLTALRRITETVAAVVLEGTTQALAGLEPPVKEMLEETVTALAVVEAEAQEQQVPLARRLEQAA